MVLTVSSAAADRKLLTLQEAKDALGITSSSQDAAITTLILRVSDMISRECLVVGDGLTPPTLREETLVETLRLKTATDKLPLSRRFVVITTIVEDGETLTTADYTVNAGAGLLTRLDDDDDEDCWPACKIVITYKAGFATVPEDLKLAAIGALREQYAMSSRDPMLRAEEVEGVGRFEFQNAFSTSSVSSALSPQVCDMLAPYKSLWVA